MYKLVVCNLGYENIFINNLDGAVELSLTDLLDIILEVIDEDIDEIDGYRVTKTRFDISENDFKDNDTVFIIETEISDRCIYIRKL